MKLLVSLLILSLSLNLILCISVKRVGKTNIKLNAKKKKFPDGPTIKNFNVEGMEPSEIEEN